MLRINAVPVSCELVGIRQATSARKSPVSLISAILSKHMAGLILDPFSGQRTTLRAAKDLGRRAIGIEIEERYCEIAAKRMSQGVLQLEAVG